MRMYVKAWSLMAVGLCAGVQGQSPLGSAADFAVLAGSTVTSTGASVVTGNLGLWPGTSVTGFPPGIVVDGDFHVADAVAQQAQADLTVAYVNFAAMPCGTDLTGLDLGLLLPLPPGVYCFDTTAGLTGTLTLDAQGDPNAEWVFQVGSALTTAVGSSVVMINGGVGANVYWQLGSSATIGVGSAFLGNIMAQASITMATGSSNLEGRLLARIGAVTLDSTLSSVFITIPPIGPQPPGGFPSGYVLWRHPADSGYNLMWVLNSLGVVEAGPLPPMPDRRWKIVAVGDFNADFFDDIVWRNQGTGRNQIWTLEAIGRLGSFTLPRVSNVDWEIVGAGDVDGNGTRDLLWRHQRTGTNKVWLMDGVTVLSRQLLPTVYPGYVLAGVGDFNGDNLSDILWRNENKGRNLVWLMNGIVVAQSSQIQAQNRAWNVVDIGDYDGDGLSDILWRREHTGQNLIWTMDGFDVAVTGALPLHPDSIWSKIGVLDVDGDVRDDVLWRNLDTGDNYIWFMDGSTLPPTRFLGPLNSSEDWSSVVGRIR